MWEYQYKHLAKKCDADFYNFKLEDGANNISSKYIDYMKKNDIFLNRLEVKTNQLNMLDKLDDCFSDGYDHVLALDADVCINPKTDFSFEKCDKDTVYFASKPGTPGGRNFEKALKTEFLEIFPLKYGNQGLLLISSSVWNSIKKNIYDIEKMLRCLKPDQKHMLFNSIDQNILSLALTLENINIDKLPQLSRFRSKNFFHHFIGGAIQGYKYLNEIDEEYFERLLHKYIDSRNIKIDKSKRKWFPLVFHYASLSPEEQYQFFLKLHPEYDKSST